MGHDDELDDAALPLLPNPPRDVPELVLDDPGDDDREPDDVDDEPGVPVGGRGGGGGGEFHPRDGAGPGR